MFSKACRGNMAAARTSCLFRLVNVCKFVDMAQEAHLHGLKSTIKEPEQRWEKVHLLHEWFTRFHVWKMVTSYHHQPLVGRSAGTHTCQFCLKVKARLYQLEFHSRYYSALQRELEITTTIRNSCQYISGKLRSKLIRTWLSTTRFTPHQRLLRECSILRIWGAVLLFPKRIWK